MKTTQLDVDLTHLQPQERPRECSPDPSWPIEKRLRWYKAYSHVLMLNVSERCRRAAFAEAEKRTA